METTIVVPPRKTPIWKILLLAAGGVLLLVLLLAFLILGTRRAWQIPEMPDGRENVITAQLIARVSNAMFTPQGSIAKRATLELTPEELDVMIRTGLRNYRRQHHAPEDPVVYAQWRDARLEAEISLPLAGDLAVNITVAAVPHLENGKLAIHLKELRAGWLPLPTAQAEKVLQKELEKYRNKPEFMLALQVVEAIRVTPSGNLSVTCQPSKISYLLMM